MYHSPRTNALSVRETSPNKIECVPRPSELQTAHDSPRTESKPGAGSGIKRKARRPPRRKMPQNPCIRASAACVSNANHEPVPRTPVPNEGVICVVPPIDVTVLLGAARHPYSTRTFPILNFRPSIIIIMWVPMAQEPRDMLLLNFNHIVLKRNQNKPHWLPTAFPALPAVAVLPLFGRFIACASVSKSLSIGAARV